MKQKIHSYGYDIHTDNSKEVARQYRERMNVAIRETITDAAIGAHIVNGIFNPSGGVRFMEDYILVSANMKARFPLATPENVLELVSEDPKTAFETREKALNYAFVRAVKLILNEQGENGQTAMPPQLIADAISGKNNSSALEVKSDAAKQILEIESPALRFLSHVAAGKAYNENKTCVENMLTAAKDLPGVSFDTVKKYANGEYTLFPNYDAI